ncbi:hypothetical protein [Nocardia bovistercoris]|uniref:Uncharacterized protein n=1 Tax=Nocardia bovistercoris TaxID=2785916 RepID=A0A931N7D7_9NOCA|nr:hypothetical protein [Nocardia bovistercoris]MBH0781491.1 hypothetical protein [Nocardia bovistercoris]
MGSEHPRAREQLELDVVREVVLARRRLDSLVLAALTLGAELTDLESPLRTESRAGEILERFAVDEDEITRDPEAALQADMARDERRARRIGLGYSGVPSEGERRRRRQMALLREVRADLLEVVRRSRRYRFDRNAFAEEIAAGLGAATDKLVVGSDMDTYDAWQRGMVLGLIEESTPHGPKVLATVDAGPERGHLTVEWDSCERRLALIARMSRAGVSPVVICDRLLADLSVSSPLRYSAR